MADGRRLLFVGALWAWLSTAWATPPQHRLQEITDTQYRDCTVGMLVSDTGRDGELDATEFVTLVNRFTDGAFAGAAFDALPNAFQNLFTSGLGDESDTIPLEGAQPGSSPTQEQLQFFRDFCIGLYTTVDQWENGGPLDTPSPTPAPQPTNPPQTQGPTLSDGDRFFCIINLYLSDNAGDKNDRLNTAEYVGYLNRQLDNVYANTPYENIATVFQQNFQSLATAGEIDITGASPSVIPTPAQDQALRRTCQETDRAIQLFDTAATPSPSVITTVPPTTVVTDDFEECKAALSTADADSNYLLTQAEYVVFLNDVSSGQSFTTFAALDAALQQPFDDSKGVFDAVPLLGARPQDSPTPDQVAFLQTFCTAAYDALEQSGNSGTPTPVVPPGLEECNAALTEADSDSNDELSQTEYIDFVNALASSSSDPFSSPFANLPYIVRDNFAWIAEDNPAVDTADVSRLEYLCARSSAVVTSAVGGNDETALMEHCYASFTAGDLDADTLLGQSEFATTVHYFLGLIGAPPAYTDLDEPFRDYFEANEISSLNAINIGGSKPGETPNPGQKLNLDYLCVQLELAVGQARQAFSLLSRCQSALQSANVDDNNVLTDAEYANFVYFLARRSSGERAFADLPRELRDNFRTLSADDSGINVVGWDGSSISAEERTALNAVCTSTDDLLELLPAGADPTPSPTAQSGDTTTNTVTIYNGFIIGNTVGLGALDLGVSDYSDLEDAYTAFVEETVSLQLGNRRLFLRGRRLDVIGVSPNSVEIYRVVNGVCPASFRGDNAKCLEAYASFDLVITDDEDENDIEDQYTRIFEQRIDDGDLQEQLETTNSDSQLVILGTTASNRPGGNVSPTPSPVASPSGDPKEDDDSNSLLGIVVIVGIVLLCCCCCGGCAYYYVRRRSSMQDGLGGGMEQAPGGLPKDTLASEGNNSFSMTDEVEAQQQNSRSLLPVSDHSHEVNFGFSGASGQRAAYNNKPNLMTVADDESDEEAEEFHDEGGEESDSDESSEGQGGGWAASNPWGGQDGAPGAVSSSASGSSQESEEMEEEEVTETEDGEESGSGSYEEEEIIEESEYSEEEIDDEEYEEEEEESEFEENPEFEESYSSASFLSSSSAAEGQQPLTPEAYREEIESLVRQVVPDEIENIDAMIEQFVGREEELITTLRSMAEQGTSITTSSDEDDDDDDEEEEDESGGSEGSEESGSYDEDEEEYEDEVSGSYTSTSYTDQQYMDEYEMEEEGESESGSSESSDYSSAFDRSENNVV